MAMAAVLVFQLFVNTNRSGVDIKLMLIDCKKNVDISSECIQSYAGDSKAVQAWVPIKCRADANC